MLRSVMTWLEVSIVHATLDGMLYDLSLSAKTVTGPQEQNLSTIEEELCFGS